MNSERPANGSSKSVSPSGPETTAPTSQVLYNKCRDLAYELRVEDAVRVLKQAEKARAQEKGYQLSETFSFHGSAESLIEPSKWAVAKSLQNLTAKDEQEMIGAVLCCRLVDGGLDEILAVTLGRSLRWPDLEEWFWRFKEA